MSLQVLVELWQFFHDAPLDDFVVLVQSGEARLQNILETILIYKCTHKPEGGNFARMVQKNGSDEIHALNITDSLLVICKCNEDSF